jgi:hypothetical protein
MKFTVNNNTKVAQGPVISMDHDEDTRFDHLENKKTGLVEKLVAGSLIVITLGYLLTLFI